jgi:hypothetical protein
MTDPTINPKRSPPMSSHDEHQVPTGPARDPETRPPDPRQQVEKHVEAILAPLHDGLAEVYDRVLAMVEAGPIDPALKEELLNGLGLLHHDLMYDVMDMLIDLPRPQLDLRAYRQAAPPM